MAPILHRRQLALHPLRHSGHSANSWSSLKASEHPSPLPPETMTRASSKRIPDKLDSIFSTSLAATVTSDNSQLTGMMLPVLFSSAFFLFAGFWPDAYNDLFTIGCIFAVSLVPVDWTDPFNPISFCFKINYFGYGCGRKTCSDRPVRSFPFRSKGRIKISASDC